MFRGNDFVVDTVTVYIFTLSGPQCMVQIHVTKSVPTTSQEI